jgi:hypothetical protein
MPHTRAEVIKRAEREFKLLDRLVGKLTPAQWKKRVPRGETRDPWTVKDALAHITYWKSGVTLAAKGERMPPEESRLNINARNRVVYLRWKRRSPKEVLAWHRQVHRDLLKALRAAPARWFARPSRGPDWPFDADGHSAAHRVKDLEGALGKGKKSN